MSKEALALILIPLGVLAATGFLCFSRRWRELGFFVWVLSLVFANALDINFLSHEWYRGTTRGIEFSFVDVLSISLLLSLMLVRKPARPPLYWPAGLTLILVFLGYCALSILLSQPRIYGVFEGTKLVRAVLALLVGAWFVRSQRELRILSAAIVCSVLIEVMLGLKERYFNGIDRVGGSLDHPNSLSMYLLLTGPILVALINSQVPAWLRAGAAAALVGATVGIVLTASRMGMPAFGLVVGGATLACVTWRLTRRKMQVALAVLVGVGAILARAWDNVKNRYEEASIREEFKEDGKENRGLYLLQAHTILRERFWGVGLNNWSYWVSKKYGPQLGLPYEDYDDIPPELMHSRIEFDWAYKYAPPAHNLAALTAGELGLPGMILLGVLWANWFWMAARFLRPRTPDLMRRFGVGIFFGLCGVFLQSLTEAAFRQTPILFTVFLLLGVLAALRRFQRVPETLEEATAAPVPQRAPGLLAPNRSGGSP